LLRHSLPSHLSAGQLSAGGHPLWRRVTADNLNHAEYIVLVIGVHDGEIASSHTSVRHHRVLQRDGCIMPLLVPVSSHCKGCLHAGSTGIVNQLPARSWLAVKPRNVYRHDFGLLVAEEVVMQLEIQGVLARGMLEPASESRID
jgi:hypothetical protein